MRKTSDITDDDLDALIVRHGRQFCRLSFNAAVYTAAAITFDVVWWKAVALGVLVMLATCLNFGRAALVGVGVVLLLLTVAVWAGVAPAPAEWPNTARSFATTLRAS